MAAPPIGPIISALQQALPQTGIRLDSAAVPNPFMGVSSKTFVDSDQQLLNLVDGGEDGEGEDDGGELAEKVGLALSLNEKVGLHELHPEGESGEGLPGEGETVDFA